MNVPLRALSWATRLFWIIAFVFVVTCAYSATLIQVDFGEPMVNLGEKDNMLTLPIIFDNKGYYNIADLNVTTTIFDSYDQSISKDTTIIPKIASKNNATILHNASFNLDSVSIRRAGANWLFDDSNFTIYTHVRLDYADIIPFGLELNSSIPWGAPLSNFTVGTLEYAMVNTTHLNVKVPVSFQNHSPYFNVTGTMRFNVLNDEQQPLVGGRSSIHVPSNSFYSEIMETYVDAAVAMEIEQINFYFDTEIFSYGPIMIGVG